MGIDYKLSLVLGIELAREEKEIEFSVTKYNEDTGVAYQQTRTKDVDVFSFRGKELFQMEMQYYSKWGNGLTSEEYKELEILPPNYRLYVSDKTVLGLEIASTPHYVRAGGNISLTIPDNVEQYIPLMLHYLWNRFGIKNLNIQLHTILSISA